MTNCCSPQTREVNELATDYLEFCKLLKDQANAEIVPLKVFAQWRIDAAISVGPVPSIN